MNSIKSNKMPRGEMKKALKINIEYNQLLVYKLGILDGYFKIKGRTFINKKDREIYSEAVMVGMGETFKSMIGDVLDTNKKMQKAQDKIEEAYVFVRDIESMHNYIGKYKEDIVNRALEK